MDQLALLIVLAASTVLCLSGIWLDIDKLIASGIVLGVSASFASLILAEMK